MTRARQIGLLGRSKFTPEYQLELRLSRSRLLRFRYRLWRAVKMFLSVFSVCMALTVACGVSCYLFFGWETYLRVLRCMFDFVAPFLPSTIVNLVRKPMTSMWGWISTGISSANFFAIHSQYWLSWGFGMDWTFMQFLSQCAYSLNFANSLCVQVNSVITTAYASVRVLIWAADNFEPIDIAQMEGFAGMP